MQREIAPHHKRKKFALSAHHSKLKFMRLSLALILCLLLAGCPAPKSPPPSQATPEPTPADAISSPEQPASEPAATHTPEPIPESTPLALTDFVGTWTTTDDQGQIFDITIFANGQVVTNWTKSKDGAYGERGLWRREGGRLIAFYHDGTSDIMEATADGIRYKGHAAGAPLDGPTVATAEAHRRPPEEAKFLGVWRLNREPDGTYQYLSLQSNGRAFSSVNGGTEGKWTVIDGAAECTWPDGWVDRLELTNDGWQKRSSIGSGADTPADISPALRVGETRFEITP